MSGPRSFEVELPGRGVSLAVHDWGGPGSVLLCAHATGFCGRLWEPVADALEERFRVIAYDARGHGDSSAPGAGDAYAWEELTRDALVLVETLCERLGLPRIEVATGNSMGGATTLAAASRRPDLFGRLALIDPVVLPPGLARAFPSDSNPMAEGARRRRALFPSRAAVIEQYRERATFAGWHPRALELYARHGFRERGDGQVELKCAPEIEAAVFARASTLDLFDEVRQLHIPCVIFHASRGSFSLETYHDLAAQSPWLRVQSFEGEHLAPMIDPERVADLLRQQA